MANENQTENDLALDELFSFETPAEIESESGDGGEPDASGADARDTEEVEASGESSESEVSSEQSADADSSDENIPEKQKADEGTTAPKTEPQKDDPLAELRRQNEELQRQLAAITQQLQQQAAAPKQEPQQPETAKQKQDDSVILEMPRELVALIESEDPGERVQGFNLLASGVATAAVEKVKQMLEPVFREGLPQMIEQITAQRQTRQTVFDDFYGAFPHLKQPHIQPIVVQTAQRLARERGAQGWSTELRDAVGAEVMKLLAGALPAAVTQPAPERRPAPPPTPRGASPSRRANGADTQQSFINDLLE